VTRAITIIGAGIVGIATASYLRRDGHDVTVVDVRPPGEYCSFGNAGILSPGSCVPLATPGVLWNVPGYLADPMGPLTVRWSYLPRALPWLLRFLAASSSRRVERIADALRSLLKQTFDAYEPLVTHAG
jgi:D-amino-acid dehydrogenase